VKRGFKILREKVLKVVEEQHLQFPQPQRREMQVLAEFVHLQLLKVNLSEGAFAQAVDLSSQDIQRLLQGQLTPEALSDEILQQIASALQCEVNLITIILNRFNPRQLFRL
jgi:hypothetical protein